MAARARRGEVEPFVGQDEILRHAVRLGVSLLGQWRQFPCRADIVAAVIGAGGATQRAGLGGRNSADAKCRGERDGPQAPARNRHFFLSGNWLSLLHWSWSWQYPRAIST